MNPSDVKIVNLRPPEVAAAWERGDIDATAIWDPVLAKVKKNGKVLITSGQIAQQTGKATFDGFVVDRKFAKDNAEFVARFVKVLAANDASYRDHTSAWTAASPQVRSRRQRVRRERAGSAGEPRALCVSDAAAAGVECVAWRRRAIGRSEVACGNGCVPENAGHDSERAGRLFGWRRSAVRAARGAMTAA